MDKRMRGLLAGALCLALLTGCGLLPQEEEALAPPVVEPSQNVNLSDELSTGA